MLDRIEDGGQTCVTFNLAQKQSGEKLSIKNSSGDVVAELKPENDCSVILYSSSDLDSEETYSLYNGDTLVAQSGSGFMGGPGMPPPGGEPPQGGMQPPQGGMEPPGGRVPPEGEPPHWN
jgi:hypothetical protein